MGKNKVEKISRDNLRALSLEEFIKVARGSLLIKYMVKSALDEKTSPHLIKRIISVNNFSNDAERKFQEEYVGLIEKNIAEIQEALTQSVSKEEAVQSLVDDVEAEFNRAREAYEEAREKLDKAKAKLESAKKATRHAKKAVLECEVSYQEALDRKEKLTISALMHPSATMAQLEEHRDYKIVASYTDAPELQKLGIVDEVFKKEQARLIEVESDYPGFYENTIQSDIKSKIAYVRMVAWYMLNDIPYVTVYADKLIDELLKYNGLI